MKKKFFTMHVDVDDFLPASDAEKEYMVKMRPSTTFFKDGMKRLMKNKIAAISMFLIIIIALGSILIPFFWPYRYDKMLGNTPGRPMDPSYNNLAPFEYSTSEQKKIDAGEKVFPHIFGTDAQGRDYFIRIVYGTRISLAVGFFASIIVLIIGLTIGSIAGYIGGKVDIIIMRIVDIIYSLPDTLMVILLGSVMKVTLGPLLEGTILERLGTNMVSLFLIFALLYWCSMARLIRGQILSLREQEFMVAAEAMGYSTGRKIFKHLVPNVMPQLIVSMTLSLIPRLMVQVKVIADSQRSIGLDWKSGSLMQRIRSGARILSILVSWALEDAVITADSMRARGYGQHKRSTFSIFRFGKKDAKMPAVILVLFAAEIFTYVSGRGTMEFYPAMVFRNIDFIDIIIYVLYITLGILPAVIQIKEDLKWKLLK